MRSVYLIGAGGHCRSCIDVVESVPQYQIAGIVGSPDQVGTQILGYSIEYVDQDIESLIGPDTYFLITIGQIKTSKPRVRLFNQIAESGGQFATIVSNRAYVSKHAKLGRGTIVMHDALVNAVASVGENCIINSKALVEHDAIVESHCHISTGATINGSARIKNKCFIGSGSIVHQDIEVGEQSLIGSNAVVKTTLPAKSCVRSGAVE